jgi:hypothetical protein
MSPTISASLRLNVLRMHGFGIGFRIGYILRRPAHEFNRWSTVVSRRFRSLTQCGTNRKSRMIAD